MAENARIWKFGDNIDTDTLAPGRYMSAPIEVLAAHCLESVRPEFAGSVKPGDIIVGGANFGVGSSREQAVEALKHLGVAVVIARSFAGIFYRNAVNLGLTVLECDETDRIPDGASARLDIEGSALFFGDDTTPVQCKPLPGFLKTIIDDGGLVPHLEKRFAAEAEA